MSSTIPPFGWPVPEDTDPLADGAGAIRALAAAVAVTMMPRVWVWTSVAVFTFANGTGNILYSGSSLGEAVPAGWRWTATPIPVVVHRSNAFPSQEVTFSVGNLDRNGFTVHARANGVAFTGTIAVAMTVTGFIEPGAATAALPDTDWTKDAIKVWLIEHGVSLTEEAMSHLTKAELLALVADLVDAEE